MVTFKAQAHPTLLIPLSNHADLKSPIQFFVLIHPLDSAFSSNNSFYYIPLLYFISPLILVVLWHFHYHYCILTLCI